MDKNLKQICQVCIPHTYHDYFDYEYRGTAPAIGSRVSVPFRQGLKIGIVIGHEVSEVPADKLKAVEQLLDEKPLLSAALLKLCRWVSRYYQSPLSEVIPLALPKTYRLGKPISLPKTYCYQISEGQSAPALKAKNQAALWALLHDYPEGLSLSAIRAEGFSRAQIDALLKKGCLQEKSMIDWPFPIKDKRDVPLDLNEAQALAKQAMLEGLSAFRCFLLQGVTGSGKTEVYLQVMTEVLAAGRQVLFLVPEIGLTPQLIARFQHRVSVPMVVIHSNLSDGERQAAWQLVADNQAKLLVGTRAAVFADMPTLGLIIIDEEHDSALKQMDGVRYSARDVALVRAQAAGVPVILGSATPSLESLYNCQQGKYQRLILKQKALNNQPLHIELKDIRAIRIQHGLADSSLEKIKSHLTAGNQVLVFINRRGFAPVMLCHQCGWMADCRHCDAHLTYHRQSDALNCHHCGRIYPVPNHCQSCQSTELIAVGAGTQRVHEYLQSCFPEQTVLRIDRDEVGRKHALRDSLEAIHSGEANLIVGTQMLAKGHHFPRLSLVVVLDADAGLYNQDFRALERLGQLLTQVAGRAGRADIAGELLIQTHQPQHPLLLCLFQQGYDAFARQLLESREAAAMPPYTHLAMLRAQSGKAHQVKQFLQTAKSRLNAEHITVFGPAPAPLAKKANQHRMQLLIKSPSRPLLGKSLDNLKSWLYQPQNTKGLRWNIDVDPQDLS